MSKLPELTTVAAAAIQAIRSITRKLGTSYGFPELGAILGNAKLEQIYMTAAIRLMIEKKIITEQEWQLAVSKSAADELEGMSKKFPDYDWNL